MADVAATTTIRVRRESDSEILFAHSPLPGLLTAGVGLAIIAVFVSGEPPPPWWLPALLGVFPLFGLLAALWRFEVHLDLIRRRFRVHRGYRPWATSHEGSLDEIHSVVLDKAWRRTSSRSGSSERLIWTIDLDAAKIGPLRVLASSDESEARQRFETLAAKLAIQAVDRSSGEERIPGHEKLDHPRSQTRTSGSSPAQAPAPPAGSRIETTPGPTGRIIVIPPLGLHPVIILLSLFGLAFAGFALLALAAASGVVPMKVTGSRELLAVMAVIFVVVGLAIAIAPLAGAFARERIEDGGDHLFFSILIAGRSTRRRMIRKAAIEKVDLRSNTASQRTAGRELFVRSNDEVIILGRDLDEDALRWLRDALTAMMTR
jgi:hypothetical protein